jgi:hypothetical protein
MKKTFNIAVYVFAAIGFVLVLVYFALQLGLTKTKGVIDNQHDYFQNQTPDWISSEEWGVLKAAVVKDTDVINRASKDTGVPARIVVSTLIVEQLRLFNSEREIFKKIFSPLKILGNQSQFSWGVMGIKQDTAKEVEAHLKDQTSPFYLGSDFEHVLDFKTDNPDNERFERLTDEHDRYYSYFYAGLIMRQLEAQWEKAGYPIDKNAGIIATLFNIGFMNSKPKANAQLGGAQIEINKTTYSFGGLAQSFYNSSELTNEFPK